MSETDNSRQTLLITYILFAVGIFIGITSLVAIVISHLKVGSAPNEFIRSHYQWLIRSFWFALIGAIIGWVTVFIFIGTIILVVVGLWYIYRIVKGFLAFNDNKPIADPTAWI